MFRRYPCAHSFLMLIIPLMLIATLIVSASGARAMTHSLERSCAGVQALELNSVARGHAASQEAHSFTVDLPAAGILAVDVIVPGHAEASPKLDMLGPDCGPLIDGGDVLVIERSTVHQVVAVGRGLYFFRLAAQDPQAALGDYRITTAFVASPVLNEPLEADAETVDPAPGMASTFPRYKANGETVDPDPGFTTRGDGHTLSELCGQRLDDHADTFTCATALRSGLRVDGEIQGIEDDADIFTFTLTREQTLRIVSAGYTDTFGSLYNHFGHRLATNDDGGQGANFRIVKTLTPGRYFLRIEGRDRAEGAYAVNVEPLEW